MPITVEAGVMNAGFDVEFLTKDTIHDFSSYAADKGFYIDFIARSKK